MITQEYEEFLGWAFTNIGMDKRPLWYIALKVNEEAGEVGESIIGLHGLQAIQKDPCNEETVADELADVVCTAIMGILRCGADPAVVLKRQADKVRARYGQ